MLSVNEIKNLENQWKRYKTKKYFKIFIYIFIVLILFVTLVLYYCNFFNDKSKVKTSKPIIQNSILKKNSTKNSRSIKIDENVKNIPIYKKNKTTIIKTSKPILNKAKVKNTQNSNILQLNTEFLSHIYDKKDSVKKGNSEITKELNNSENNHAKEKKLFTSKTSVKKIKQEIQPSAKQYKKAKIIISSKKIDKLEYLKEQYYETKKAFYAILISKEYYKKKLYSKSLLWATTANNIDSSNEESWIMFAKSKVKLGKRSDAINALSAYLKVNSSQKIKILLRNIKKGVFK